MGIEVEKERAITIANEYLERKELKEAFTFMEACNITD